MTNAANTETIQTQPSAPLVKVTAPPLKAPALAAFLSFVIPGLGQIYQGIAGCNRRRLLKGVFFMSSLLGLFFYGQWLGHWRVVYLPHAQEEWFEAERRGEAKQAVRLWPTDKIAPALIGDLRIRLPYLGQFWVGAAAWPAIWNYYFPDWSIFGTYQASPGAIKKGEVADRRTLLIDADQADSDLQMRTDIGRCYDLGWMYTVIAGVLNLLVIYDAYAGPVKMKAAPEEKQEKGANP